MIRPGPLPALPPGDLWVYGYGSLIWRPGFEYVDACPARIYGYRRALCVWSWVHRGTRERPGLVFGLDRGGSCIGRAFRVPSDAKEQVATYLYERELVTPVYQPRLLAIRAGGRTVTALTFTVDRHHPQYAGDLAPVQAARVVSQARGRSGPNAEYLINTVTSLEQLGVRCGQLQAIRNLLAEEG